VGPAEVEPQAAAEVEPQVTPEIVLQAQAADSVCAIGGASYLSLGDALYNARNNDTIRLLTNINYSQPIIISGISLNFDLNGYVLNVNTSLGDALTVSDAGQVKLIDNVGTGALNVTSTADAWHYLFTDTGRGVVVTGGSIATVTNATGTTCGAFAEGEGSVVTVTGNVFVPYTNTTIITTGVYSDYATVNVGGNVSGTWYGVVCYYSQITIGGNVSTEIFYTVEALRNSFVHVYGNTIGTYYESPNLHSGSQCIVEGRISFMGTKIEAGEFIPIEVYNGIGLNNKLFHLGQGVASQSHPGYAELTDGDCYLWVRMTPEIDLAAAKYAKYIIIRTVKDTRDANDYTPESWQDLLLAVNAACNVVWDATTYEAIAAVPVPDAGSILVPVQPVGAPGSGDPFGRGYTTMDIAIMTARIAVGMETTLTEPQRAALDMDFDGYLTMTDVLLIMRKSCGLDN
jgi:hypothetical protein